MQTYEISSAGTTMCFLLRQITVSPIGNALLITYEHNHLLHQIKVTQELLAGFWEILGGMESIDLKEIAESKKDQLAIVACFHSGINIMNTDELKKFQQTLPGYHLDELTPTSCQHKGFLIEGRVADRISQFEVEIIKVERGGVDLTEAFQVMESLDLFHEPLCDAFEARLTEDDIEEYLAAYEHFCSGKATAA